MSSRCLALAGGRAGSPPRGGRAVGRCRGWRLDELAGRRSRSGPQGSGPSAPAPCLSAGREDAGLEGELARADGSPEASPPARAWDWVRGRTPRIRDMRGRGAPLGHRGRGGRAGPGTRSRKPLRRNPRRDLGLGLEIRGGLPRTRPSHAARGPRSG